MPRCPVHLYDGAGNPDIVSSADGKFWLCTHNAGERPVHRWPQICIREGCKRAAEYISLPTILTRGLDEATADGGLAAIREAPVAFEHSGAICADHFRADLTAQQGYESTGNL